MSDIPPLPAAPGISHEGENFREPLSPIEARGLGRVHFSLASPCHAKIGIINGAPPHLFRLYNETASLAAVTNNRHVPLSYRSGFPCCALRDGRPRRSGFQPVLLQAH